MRRQTKGFTLVELMFAVAFVATLLVAIAFLTIQILNVYTKGTTLNAANQAGQIISSELQRELAQASSPDRIKFEPVGSDVNNPIGWRICTGSESYIWNYGKTMVSSGTEYANPNVYDNGSKVLRFVKVDDNDQSMCQQVDSKYPNVPKNSSTELLNDESHNLAIHNFAYQDNDVGGGQKIFALSMTIGTNDREAFIDGQTKCRPPSDGFDQFCAVNVFNFTVRAGNQDVQGGQDGQST